MSCSVRRRVSGLTARGQRAAITASTCLPPPSTDTHRHSPTGAVAGGVLSPGYSAVMSPPPGFSCGGSGRLSAIAAAAPSSSAALRYVALGVPLRLLGPFVTVIMDAEEETEETTIKSAIG